MSESLINFSVALILGSSVIVVCLSVYFVHRTARTSGLSEKSRISTTLSTTASLVVWLMTALYLSSGKILAGNGRIAGLVTVFLPMILGTLFLFASKNLRRINRRMPAHWLIALQFYRVAGAIFLFPFYAYDLLPAGFAIPAGVGDVIVGLTAPLIALKVARKNNGWLAAATLWNAFGILDLIVAPAAALLSGAQNIGQFPLIIIPLFLGPPLGTLLHIYSLANIATAKKSHTAEKDNFGNHSIGTSRDFENLSNA